MSDAPTSAGIATVVVGIIVGTLEGLKSRRRKRLAGEVEAENDRSDPIRAMSALIGQLTQRVHDMENKQERWEQRLEHMVEVVDRFEIHYAKFTTEARKDLLHLGEQMRELKSELRAARSEKEKK